jgi:inner membrane protein YidH
LAWWRTGLTALAVALGVGRVVPELNRSAVRWPYVVAGVGFALWGILALGYGSARRAAVDRVLESGHFPEPPRWVLRALATGGAVLGLLTAVLILLD